MWATIYIGDVMERLRDLRDECVQCVVTSPPYWGLRDYGTALWEGGDAGCDHTTTRRGHGDEKQSTSAGTSRDSLAGLKDCRRCGARRIDSQIGLEPTPDAYIAELVAVFREVRRVLRKDGTLWLNMGDSYASGKGTCYNPGGGETSLGQDRKAEGVHPLDRGNKSALAAVGLKPKDFCGIPWMLAFALRADGWWLRQDIIWSKPNPMPESVTDRCTKAHEYLFLLTKSARYYWDQEAIAERRVSDHDAGSFRGGCYVEGEIDNGTMGKRKTSGDSKDVDPYRNKRSVWEIATQLFSEAHFATFPEKLVEPCILAGTSERGACPQCGAPWERVVECTEEYAAFKDKERQRKGKGNASGGSMRVRNLEALGLTRGTGNKSVSRQTETTGWQPTCRCADPDLCSLIPAPCIVLDPFCGSGTTGVVALRYHRDFLGIELNPEYAEMAERRIGGEIPLFAGVEVIRPKPAIAKVG